MQKDFTTWIDLDMANKRDCHYVKPAELIIAEFDHWSALLAMNAYIDAVECGERTQDRDIYNCLEAALIAAEDNLLTIREKQLNQERTIL